MFNTISKKISFGFIIVSIVSMLSMILLVGYAGAKIVIEKTTSDTETLAKQISISIRNMDTNDKDKIQKYIEESASKSDTVSSIDLNTPDGIIHFSSDSSKVGQGSEDFVKKAISSRTIQHHNASNGLEIAVPIEVEGKLLGCISITNNMDSILTTIVKAFKKIGFFIIALLALIITGGLFTSSRISKPIKNTVSALEKISRGDFTVDMKVESRDELGALAKAMNKTMASLREMIGNIKDTTINLDEVTHTLSASSEEVSSASMEIANSAGNVADGASDQSTHLEEAVKFLEDFGRTLDTINQNVENVSDASSKIKSSADLGSIKIEELVKSVEDIKLAFNYVVDKLRALNISVEKITEITTVINNVAGQTNLLALNASIEAARAGEMGKGFAVVADEIRVLAEQVSTSSKSIMNLVTTVTSETKEVSNTAESVNDKMEAQVETVENTVLSFKDILNNVLLIIPQIQKVNTALESAVNSKEEVIIKVESVSDVSKKVSAASQEISASTEEQTAAAEELTATAQNLANMSSKLHSSVDKFAI